MCAAHQRFRPPGLGGAGNGADIWNGVPSGLPVIPVKAEIQSVGSAFPKACGVDSPAMAGREWPAAWSAHVSQIALLQNYLHRCTHVVYGTGAGLILN